MANKNVMNWHEYFIRIADIIKSKSKDQSTKVSAVLVDDKNSILGVGYNGFPRGVNDDIQSRHERPVKMLYTEHAERNAIYNAVRNGVKLDGAKIYLSNYGISCAECTRAIIQSGIKEIICRQGKFEGKDKQWEQSILVSKEMLNETNVKVIYLNDKFEEVPEIE
jgi:dCMP deaminase